MYDAALLHAGLGDWDQAFECLKKAYEQHDKGMTFLAVGPTADALRSHLRFHELVCCMDFPP